MSTSAAAELEADHLALLAGQMPVLDIAGVYETLRESLAAEQCAYVAARSAGDTAAAAAAVAEARDLTGLMATLVSELSYRQRLAFARGWQWPLTGWTL